MTPSVQATEGDSTIDARQEKKKQIQERLGRRIQPGEASKRTT